jgi:hypothetical protein
MDYTVEVYKRDGRTRAGERLECKLSYPVCMSPLQLEKDLVKVFTAAKGFRLEIHETFVTRKNLVTGKKFQERYDTPSFCSPSSESFWAN